MHPLQLYSPSFAATRPGSLYSVPLRRSHTVRGRWLAAPDPRAGGSMVGLFNCSTTSTAHVSLGGQDAFIAPDQFCECADVSELDCRSGHAWLYAVYRVPDPAADGLDAAMARVRL